MSTHAVTGPTFPGGWPDLIDAVIAAVRAPASVDWNPETSTATYTFTPDLTAAEATAFADTVATFRAVVDLTPADYAAMKAQLATGRAFLGLSQADFIALTQNQRDRMLFDNMSAQWRVIFRLLRD